MYPLEAQVVDASHLKLKWPIPIPPGSRVLITIAPANNGDENQIWYELSVQGLEAAYGAEEPEYPSDLIRSWNPEYRR